jgi:hypothetical protein
MVMERLKDNAPDIVYLFKADPENDSEDLRYSLRSLRNFLHNKVIIAGEKPGWARNIIHIPIAQTKTKGKNWTMNLHAAASSEFVSDDFVMMNDDFFINNPIAEIPNINLGPMDQVVADYKTRYPEGTPYITNMVALYNVLLQKGYNDPVSYELHTPMMLNKRRVLELRDLMAKEPLYQYRTFYGNYFGIGGTAVKDVKVFRNPQHNDPLYIADPDAYLREQVFLSTTGGEFKNGAAGYYIKNRFSEKSPYEV